MENVEMLYKLYNDSKVISINKKDTSRSEEDKRYALITYLKEHYSFTKEEMEYYNLAYNTIVPFASLKMSGMLGWTIRVGKVEYIPKILDFIYYQLTREDLELSNIS